MIGPGIDKASLVLFGLVVLGFGSAFSLTHIAVASVPPLWVATGRSFIALLGITVFLVLRGRPAKLDLALVWTCVFVGMLTGVVPYTLISWGQQFIPSSMGGVLFASSPLLTLVLGAALFKARRPRLAALGGAVIGLGGVALSFSAPSDLTGQFMAGAFATVLAAASYSLGGLILQRQRIPDMVAFGAAQLVAATVTLALIACFAEGAPPSHLPHISAIALLALGLVGTCVPVLSLFYLVDRKGAQTAALTTFFIPFATVAIGVGVLGEALPSTMLYGLCAVVIGSVLIFRNRPR